MSNTTLPRICASIAIACCAFILLLVAAGASAALAAPAAPPPTLDRVSPAGGPDDLDTTITVDGAGFAREVVTAPVGITLPTVFLGTTALRQTGWISSTRLTATVPFGLQPGAYTLRVTNPDGQSASLTGAFTVTQAFGRWTTGGPYGGTVTGIVVDPATPSTLYANARIALYRSEDAGAHWVPIQAGASFDSLAIDPVSPQTLYASDMRGTRVMRSDDRGGTWTDIPVSGFSSPWYDTTLAVQKTVTGTVVYVGLRPHSGEAATPGGLFRSTNKGATWVDLAQTMTDTQVSALAFDPADAQIVYAGTASGNVLRTTDGGGHWTSIGKPDTYVSQLAVDPFATDEVWAGGGGMGLPGTFLGRYHDGVWTRVDPATGGNGSTVGAALAFDPSHTGVLWIGASGGVFRTGNGGSSWAQTAPGQPGGDWAWSVALHPSDPQIAYASFGPKGVWATADAGATWEARNDGLAALVPASLAALPADPATVFGAINGVGIYKSTNGGAEWSLLDAGMFAQGGPNTLAVDSATPARVYAGFFGGGEASGVRTSDDGGLSWQHADFPTVAITSCAECKADPLVSVATGAGNAIHVVVGVRYQVPNSPTNHGGGLYSSADRGTTWQHSDLGTAIPAVDALAADPSDPLYVYAGTECEAGSSSPAVVWRSTDGGVTWQAHGSGLESLCGIKTLAVEPGTHRVFATYGAGLMISTDRGATWAAGSLPELGDDAVTQMRFTPGPASVLYAATTGGLYRSYDGATTWQRATGALGQLSVQALEVVAASERSIVYAATLGGTAGATGVRAASAGELLAAGVYRYTLPAFTPRAYLPMAVTRR